jgi:hypothetical protein
MGFFTVTHDMLDKGYCPVCNRYFPGSRPLPSRAETDGRSQAVRSHIRVMVSKGDHFHKLLKIADAIGQ